jgi:hypothetical protein
MNQPVVCACGRKEKVVEVLGGRPSVVMVSLVVVVVCGVHDTGRSQGRDTR